MQPFLKWAGGKRWLVKNHSNLFPECYNNYIEPFLGSGAVFFHLLPSTSMLSDANGRLIETYKAIKENHNLVERYLKRHHELHSKDHYYEIRSKNYQSQYTRAAQFIYLNRTCYNGLYRENKKGVFNVPIGTKTNVLLKTDNFKNVSSSLQNAHLKHQDFEESINFAQEGDFLFVDPPYTVAHNCNGFVKYNQTIFSWEDQLRLKDALLAAKLRGAQILLTNAAHSSINDIYKDHSEVNEVSRRSVISGINAGRNKTSEYLIEI